MCCSMNQPLVNLANLNQYLRAYSTLGALRTPKRYRYYSISSFYIFPLSRALCSSWHPAPMFSQAVSCHTSDPPVGELQVHPTTLPGPWWAQQLLSRGVSLNLDAAAARPQSIL